MQTQPLVISCSSLAVISWLKKSINIINCKCVCCQCIELLMCVFISRPQVTNLLRPSSLIKLFRKYPLYSLIKNNSQLYFDKNNVCFHFLSQISCCLNLCRRGVNSIGLKVMCHKMTSQYGLHLQVKTTWCNIKNWLRLSLVNVENAYNALSNCSYVFFSIIVLIFRCVANIHTYYVNYPKISTADFID